MENLMEYHDIVSEIALRKSLSHILFITFSFISVFTLFYQEHSCKQQAEIGKKKNANAKKHPESQLLLFENYSLSLFTLSPKNNRRYSKKCKKNTYLFSKEIIWLITMKMRLKIKNRSHRYDINRPGLRHGNK